MSKMRTNIKLKTKDGLLEKGFVEINKEIYRKFISIGYNIGMYVTIGVKDDFLNIAFLNEALFQPYNLEGTNNIFNENCIINYNNEIESLIKMDVLAEY